MGLDHRLGLKCATFFWLLVSHVLSCLLYCHDIRQWGRVSWLMSPASFSKVVAITNFISSRHQAVGESLLIDVPSSVVRPQIAFYPNGQFGPSCFFGHPPHLWPMASWNFTLLVFLFHAKNALDWFWRASNQHQWTGKLIVGPFSVSQNWGQFSSDLPKTLSSLEGSQTW